MCRIAAIVDFNKTVTYNVVETIDAMKDSMQKGGPDDEGIFIDQSKNCTLALGHRRLSIIDLTPCGHQPMFTADKNIMIIFNGEIYNYQEIKKELLQIGYAFLTQSDTEVIIQAYLAWGIECVNKFIGMFAFVLFDKKKQQVYALRDRAGVKPLYYYHHENLFLFASELKSFHQHPNFKKEINTDSVALFLQLSYIPAPHSIFKNTYKILPGHYLCINMQNQTLVDHTYWNATGFYRQPLIKDIASNEIVEHTEDLLKSACDYRMVADVPVGVFLSGGYDSSLVTALLQKDTIQKIKTFSIGFNEKKFNEAPFAKKVAEHLGTDHTEFYCTQKDALEIIPLLPEIYDEPFGDSSAIPTTLVSKIARQSVKVSLSADGGDELFGGYEKYSAVIGTKQKMNSVPTTLSKIAGSFIDKINPEFIFENAPFVKRSAKLAMMLQSSNLKEMMYWFDCGNTSDELKYIINTPYNPPNKSLYTDIESSDEINSMLAIDYVNYLPGDILTKVDRATMSVGLEGREPLLDHRLLEWMAQIPGEIKIKNGEKKTILKEIVHKYIPRIIMDRPKMGFGVPINIWFKKELKDYFNTYLSAAALQKHHLFNIENIEKKKKAYFKGNDRLVPELWNLLMFQMWYEKWMN